MPRPEEPHAASCLKRAFGDLKNEEVMHEVSAIMAHVNFPLVLFSRPNTHTVKEGRRKTRREKVPRVEPRAGPRGAPRAAAGPLPPAVLPRGRRADEPVYAVRGG